VSESTVAERVPLSTIRAVILDYGQVLCHAPRYDAIERMARILNVSSEDYPEIYARSRGSYDRGDLTPTAYWSSLADSTGARIDEKTIESLRRWDVEMWSTVNLEMVEWAVQLRATGFRTAILSNMEWDMVKHMRKSFAWLRNFHHQVFSCEVRLIKPDPAIYQLSLAYLGLPSSEVLFIDDRSANIDAARALGLRAIQFESSRQLRVELENLDFTVLPKAASGPMASNEH
jgi:putative hydrolase of the HAD superfamily